MAVLLALGMASGMLVAATGARGGAGVTGSAESALLLSVSCASAGMCMAVGSRQSTGELGALAEKWNGTTWTIIPAAHPRGAIHTYFYAVSCSSSHACMAVGGYSTKSHPGGSVPLAELWNGKTWRVKVTPRPTGDSALGSVSCRSATWCMAVGEGGTSTNKGFSEEWDGRRWTIKRTASPPGTTFSTLESVSCATARVCMAVGDYQVHHSAHTRTLAELWNGKKWARRATLNPVSGANGSSLNGVSCRSAIACVAVGSYVDVSDSGGLALAETWNGMVWTRAAVDDDPTQVRVLEGVSCRSTNACVAVGISESTSPSIGSTLAERWTGDQWTVEGTPNPNGATDSELDGVSCASPAACVAVGSYFTNSGMGGLSLPLTEVWNGVSWTLVTTPF